MRLTGVENIFDKIAIDIHINLYITPLHQDIETIYTILRLIA